MPRFVSKCITARTAPSRSLDAIKSDVVRLDRRVFGGRRSYDAPFSKPTWEAIWQSSKRITYVFHTKSAEVIAYLSVEISGPRKFYIATIGVDIGARHQGLATRLLRRLERRKFDTISLHVAVINQSAIAFYERNGFVVTRRVRHYYGRNDDALYMQKHRLPLAPKKRGKL